MTPDQKATTTAQPLDRMRPALTLLFLALLSGLPALSQNGIENVIVETYYISDANDATDTIGAGPGGLAVGSTTYRVYLDLCDSCALRAIYGDVNHTLRINSTAVFFNHLDRGDTYGHLINNSSLDEGTVALDSWLSLGAASNQKAGILKVDDTDGTIVSPNDGGSLPVPDPGLLQNTDIAVGIPLSQQDGMIPAPGGNPVPPSFSVTGLQPSTVFDDSTLFNEFVTNDTRIACASPGVKGPTADNRLILAQFTTMGDLTFCLNVEVERPDGSITKYVCNGDSALQPDETVNGLLVYPPTCGCTDPNFLEFDPNAGCDDGSCATAIIFGCLDTLACNFDPGANFNISQLCCYGPDSCNGLDVTILCPGVGLEESLAATDISLYPNPATAVLHVRGLDGLGNTTGIRLAVCDPLGQVVIERSLPVATHGDVALSVQGLAPGAYVLWISAPDRSWSRVFIRE